jgi:hypothetical protein
MYRDRVAKAGTSCNITPSSSRHGRSAFSVNVARLVVVIYGVFYGSQDFERVLRATDGGV